MAYKERLLLYAGCFVACLFLDGQLDGLTNLNPVVSMSCKAAGAFLLIAAFYFLIQAWPLARRLDDQRRFRIEAEKAPLILGLSRNPAAFDDHCEEDEF